MSHNKILKYLFLVNNIAVRYHIDYDIIKGLKMLKLKDISEGLDVRQFIQDNYVPYYGGSDFLVGATERTKVLNKKYMALVDLEQKNRGVLGIDVSRASSLLTYKAGYIDKSLELIVGLQTENALIRGVNPFGGMRMVEEACENYGETLSDNVKKEFTYRTTHNDGVFHAYTKEMRSLRSSHILTGLPDAYGRGRIIGDYRRVALYGIDNLIKAKQLDLDSLGTSHESYMLDEQIRLREDVWKQIDFLKKLASMANLYGCDISKPATTAKEAIQATYFGYLAAIKEQNGAAESFGRNAAFFDVYIENDIKAGILTEVSAQELIDDLVLHLRTSRQLRTSEYNELFAGDPTWTTESLGGMGEDGRTLVTKTAFRLLHTLETLGPAPEPNLTILWSKNLPIGWKEYCAKISILTDSIQYENDDLMRSRYGDDYAIACCVSAMTLGKQMQFFGARCNLPKLLLMSINGGKEEIKDSQIGPILPIQVGEEPLNYDIVLENFKKNIAWLAHQYVNTMNVIHYMHDKYSYEKIQMALHDTYVKRWMAFGLAGISVVADSLSAIKYAKVKAIRNENNVAKHFEIVGDFPKFGNDDDRVDSIAKDITNLFYEELCKTPCYRNAVHTLSLLTITSNVMYGKNTGDTPDGRKMGEPFAPGANPMHGRDSMGAICSLNSVAKISYDSCRDGISNTFTIVPSTLGETEEIQTENLVTLLDGYFIQGAHHLNVNVFDKTLLIDAKNHPDKYPNLTIRVSGYAVKFNSLSEKHKDEVIARTCHSCM